MYLHFLCVFSRLWTDFQTWQCCMHGLGYALYAVTVTQLIPKCHQGETNSIFPRNLQLCKYNHPPWKCIWPLCIFHFLYFFFLFSLFWYLLAWSFCHFAPFTFFLHAMMPTALPRYLRWRHLKLRLRTTRRQPKKHKIWYFRVDFPIKDWLYFFLLNTVL